MFTIIGGDGKEYGPVNTEQVRAWIAAGRANFETRAKLEGTDDWRPLGDFPEFTPPAAPPPLMVGEIVDTGLADRGARLLARIVDEICSIICALPGIALLGVSFLTSVARGERNFEDLDMAAAGLGFLVMGLGLLAITIVQIWMISTRGQTIGKRLFDIRIVRAENSALPGFVHGWLLRNFVPGIIGLVPFGLGFIFAVVDACFIFRPDRRCIHDFIAGTRVVKA